MILSDLLNADNVILSRLKCEPKLVSKVKLRFFFWIDALELLFGRLHSKTDYSLSLMTDGHRQQEFLDPIFRSLVAGKNFEYFFRLEME